MSRRLKITKTSIDAAYLHRKIGNTKWADSEGLKTSQLNEYDVFNNLGHKSNARAPDGYMKILTVDFVCAVKHDGRYKSRVVAVGHLTEICKPYAVSP